jgi:hypothetical protein
MQRIAILLVVAWACWPLAAQILPDTPANRRIAAQRYLKAVPATDLVTETVDRVASELPVDRREEFKQALAKVVKAERIEKITQDALVKHFTVKEINALAAFYGSAEGRSITKKFGAYLADVMPAIQEELSGAMEEIHKEIP